MSRPKVNYDRLASTYDLRFQDEKRSNTSSQLISLARNTKAHMILEVGCGTGHWLSEMNCQLPSTQRLFGLDLSHKMLLQTPHGECRFSLIQSAAEMIPFVDNSFGLIFCVNAIHHFNEPKLFIQDAFRALQPGGTAAIIGTDPRSTANQWYIYDFFAGTYQTDIERFPSWGMVMDWFIEAGFEIITWRSVETIEDIKYGSDVLSDPYLKKNACSQLALLSDQEYAEGMTHIKNAIARTETDEEKKAFKSIIQIKMLTAEKPVD